MKRHDAYHVTGDDPGLLASRAITSNLDCNENQRTYGPTCYSKLILGYEVSPELDFDVIVGLDAFDWNADAVKSLI